MRTSLFGTLRPSWTSSLLQHDLRGSFAVEAERAVGQLDHSTHGLTHRVEGVHLGARVRALDGF